MRTRTGRRLGVHGVAVLMLSVAAGCAEDSAAPPAVSVSASATPSVSPTPVLEPRDDLRQVFSDAGVVGTFVLFDVTGGRTTVVDPERAQRRAVPASTFKVPHSLVALETGAVRDLDEVIPWDGRSAARPEWERDMSVREALKTSNAAAYQQIARRIGLERERDWLERLDYGNKDPGEQVDRFWLDGPLTISPVEQTRWLERLAQRALPVSIPTMAAVEQALQVEHTDSYALYAKTGWQFSADPQIGWWVGWIRHSDGRLYTFALNLDIEKDADAELRIPLARTMLQRLGALPLPTASPTPN